MRVLFIGGTGIISTACAKLAVARWDKLIAACRRGLAAAKKDFGQPV